MKTIVSIGKTLKDNLTKEEYLYQNRLVKICKIMLKNIEG